MVNNAPRAFALLLLPPPPQPSSPATLNAAYRPPIKAAVQKLKRLSANSSTNASIDIALPYLDYNIGQNQRTFSGCEESTLYSVQELFVNTYTLISSICNEQEKLDTLPGKTYINNVDIRVILIGYDQAFNYDTLIRPVRPIPSCIVDLSVLALCDRNWSHVYVTQGEPGERLYRQFRMLVNGKLSSRVGGTWVTERVPGGMSLNITRQTGPIATAATTDGDTRKRARQQVLVIGEEGSKKTGSERNTTDLNQKLQLTIALLLAEFNGGEDGKESKNVDHENSSFPIPPSSNSPRSHSALEARRFLQSIVDWRLAGDRFSKTQPARLRFELSACDSIAIHPWQLAYLTDPQQQLEQLLADTGSGGEGDDTDIENTLVLGESQKDGLVNLLEPFKDRFRMVVCKDLKTSSSPSEELHQDHLVTQN
ncbi:hypothetical protein PABG_07578 [Paracoccidioides brasiliensis Pb03]|nr:hypothetical protein PABG_07578 [Paracoccidioides brasiliensis Pb03]